MTRTALIPPAALAVAERLQMSPGILSGGFVFLTGITGSAPNGTMPQTPESQFDSVFAKAAEVLAEADAALDSIVEMTSYHIGLREHFDLFDTVRRAQLSAPYPAWTAIEAAALRRPGAVVEVRFVADLSAKTGARQTDGGPDR